MSKISSNRRYRNGLGSSSARPYKCNVGSVATLESCARWSVMLPVVIYGKSLFFSNIILISTTLLILEFHYDSRNFIMILGIPRKSTFYYRFSQLFVILIVNIDSKNGQICW